MEVVTRTTLAAGALGTLSAAAAAAWPEEACGALFGERLGGRFRVGELLPLANVSTDPRHAYAIEPGELARALVAHGGCHDLLGFFHSHPEGDAAPSATDLAAGWPGSLYLIVPCPGGVPGDVAAWMAEGGGWVRLGLEAGGPA